jgi:hypothetical protein
MSPKEILLKLFIAIIAIYSCNEFKSSWQMCYFVSLVNNITLVITTNKRLFKEKKKKKLL